MKRAFGPLLAVLVCTLLLIATATAAFQLSHIEKNVADCSSAQSDYTISLIVEDTGIQLDNTSVEQCTLLLVQNNSSKRFALAFGDHQNHYPYDGYEERTIRPGKSLTVTLSEAGTFRLHNHYDESQEVALNIY